MSTNQLSHTLINSLCNHNTLQTMAKNKNLLLNRLHNHNNTIHRKIRSNYTTQYNLHYNRYIHTLSNYNLSSTNSISSICNNPNKHTFVSQTNSNISNTSNEQQHSNNNNNNNNNNKRSSIAGSKLANVTHNVTDTASSVLHHRYEQTRELGSYIRDQFQRNFYRSIGVTTGTLIVILFLIHLFRERVKDETAVQIADVAKRSLESNTVQLQVNQLSQDVVKKLLNDDNVRYNAMLFVQQLLQHEQTQQILVQLAIQVLKDDNTIQQATVLGKELANRLSVDPHVQTLMVNMCNKAINHPDNVAALGVLVRNVVNEEYTKETLLQSLKVAAHDTLQDDTVRAEATEMMKRILQDPDLQKQSGDAAWHAMKYAIGLGSATAPHKHDHTLTKQRSKSDADTATATATTPATTATISNANNNNNNNNTTTTTPMTVNSQTTPPLTIPTQQPVKPRSPLRKNTDDNNVNVNCTANGNGHLVPSIDHFH